ncbi:nicotinate (nicotinamide) nucleotide adenylyltransferase [Alphaproteobacteria bacterium LSUCC0684]
MLARIQHAQRVFRHAARQRIGLLGGSFNPAHDGHAHITNLALRHLRLDAVWWLVSPQNPFKARSGMSSFRDRFNSAVNAASACGYGRKMVVSDLELRLGTSRTADTLRLLKRRMPMCRLVWIMGADNLASFHRWHQSHRIARLMPIAVINRPGTRCGVLNGPGAARIGTRSSPRRIAARLGEARRWCFIPGPLNRQSATAIRHRVNESPET